MKPCTGDIHRATLVAFAIGLAGCVPDPEHEVSLKASFWSTPAIEQRVASEFEAAHPEIRVDLILTGGRYAEKVQSMIVAGNAPDVIMVTSAFYDDWAARDVLADITDLVAELDSAGPFTAGPKEAFRFHDRYYAVPATFDALVSITNLDALDAVGFSLPDETFTWAKLEAWGPRLSRLAGDSTAPTDYLCALPPPAYFLVAYGVQCFDDPRRPRRVTVDSPIAVEAIEYWRRMHQRGWAVDRGTVLDQGESEMFRDGRIAFTFWGRSVTTILLQSRTLRWDVAPLPAGPRGRFVPYLAGAVGISRTTAHPTEARAYLRHYASLAGARAFVEGSRGLPLRQTPGGAALRAEITVPASVESYYQAMAMETLATVVQAPGKMAVEEMVSRRFEQALAAPGVPAAEIVAALVADLNQWLARGERPSG